MNLEELEASFRRLIRALPDIVLNQTEVAANDIMGLVDQRLVETGTNASGTSFEDYTPDYKARKVKLGRYTGKVDFQLTGQMLASTATGLKNITTKSATSSGAVAVVVIGPRDEETRRKVEGNDKHRPGFLNPSKDEVKRIENIRTKRIEELIREEYFA